MDNSKRDLPDWMRPKNEIEALLLDLHDALTAWVTTGEAQYVAKYHNVYHQLCSVGWDENLDREVWLPEDLRPKTYISQYWHQ